MDHREARSRPENASQVRDRAEGIIRIDGSGSGCRGVGEDAPMKVFGRFRGNFDESGGVVEVAVARWRHVSWACVFWMALLEVRFVT